MSRAARGIWMTVLIGVILNLMVLVSQLPSSAQQTGSLKPPATAKINVAFLISKGVDVMDIAGPWEAFGDTMLTAKGKPWYFSEHSSEGGDMLMDDMVMPFDLYTVSDSLKPVDANGLTIMPNYSFDNAPKPQIIVVPAQSGRTAAQKAWLLANSASADVTMSVCTGAAVLAEYGLLDGQTATTHHNFQTSMQKSYPAVRFVSGTRFVENGKIATAGGLTSGIDLALHIVARYYGNDVAQVTAEILEHRSDLWRNPVYDQVKPVVASK